MKNTTKKLTISAIMTALAVAIMYVSSFLPTGQYGFAALASLVGYAAVIEAGLGGGIFVYVGASVLGLLIAPVKMSALLFALFFGYYPVIKSLAERIKNRVLGWVLKLAVFNGALTLILLVFKELVFDYVSKIGNTFLFYIIFNVIFIAFDYGISKLISFYMMKIHKKVA